MTYCTAACFDIGIARWRIGQRFDTAGVWRMADGVAVADAGLRRCGAVVPDGTRVRQGAARHEIADR